MAAAFRTRRSTTLILGLALAGLAQGAEVYRWVDAAGNVHFGDAEPLDGQAEVVDLEAEEPLTDDPLFSTPVPTAPARAPVPAGRQPAALGQVDEAACQRAQNDIAVLAGDAPVYLTAGGEYGTGSTADPDRLGWLSPGQRSTYLALARQRAQRFCADPDLAAAGRPD